MLRAGSAPRPARSGWIVRALVLVALLGFALANARPALGVTRTWTGLGPTNNWTDALNWSGNAVPGAADVATFDATSAKNATINVAANVHGLAIAAGYAGTITQAAGIALTVGATGYSQAGATFTAGTAAITVNGPFTLSAGSFAATSGTMSIAGAYTHTAGGSFSANGGTVAWTTGAATIDVAASETFNNVRFTAGAKTVAAGDTLNVTGALTLTAGSIVTGTVAAQGDVSQALGYGGGSGTLLHQRDRRPDPDRRVHDRQRQPADRRHQQALGHADPRRHDPDRQQLDVHRGDARPGDVARSSSPAAR